MWSSGIKCVENKLKILGIDTDNVLEINDSLLVIPERIVVENFEVTLYNCELIPIGSNWKKRRKVAELSFIINSEVYTVREGEEYIYLTLDKDFNILSKIDVLKYTKIRHIKSVNFMSFERQNLIQIESSGLNLGEIDILINREIMDKDETYKYKKGFYALETVIEYNKYIYNICELLIERIDIGNGWVKKIPIQFGLKTHYIGEFTYKEERYTGILASKGDKITAYYKNGEEMEELRGEELDKEQLVYLVSENTYNRLGMLEKILHMKNAQIKNEDIVYFVKEKENRRVTTCCMGM